MVDCMLRATEAPRDWGRRQFALAVLGAGLDGQSGVERETGGNRCIWETGGCRWTEGGCGLQEAELRIGDELGVGAGGEDTKVPDSALLGSGPSQLQAPWAGAQVRCGSQ